MPGKRSRRKIGKTYFTVDGLKKLIGRMLVCASLTLLVFLTVFFVYFFLFYRSTVSMSKPINIAILYEDTISLFKYDPQVPEVLEVSIPGALLLTTAGNYGRYQIKNIYSLSENEIGDDVILKNSIMKNFGIPIHKTLNCSEQNFGGNFSYKRLALCTNKDNIKEIFLMMFLKLNSNGNYIVKPLDDYGVINNDAGGVEYYLSENVFSKMEFDFSQNINIENVVGVHIKTPDEVEVPRYFYNVVKLAGGRVVEQSCTSLMDTGGCRVVGGDKNFVKNLASIFGCDQKLSGGTDDVEVYFSKDYLDIF